MINTIPPNEFHFAGHDTFHLRYTWLPKAADYLKNNSGVKVSLSTYDTLMIELGIGKNMAKALRHWAESSQLFQKDRDGTLSYHTFTDLGEIIFNDDNGLDRYLELPSTIWLLHYLINSNHKKNSLWYYLFNVFNEHVIKKEEFLFSASNWFADQGKDDINQNTIGSDFLCCMMMYNNDKSLSDNISTNMISSPLKELKLIKKIGQDYRLRSITTKEIPLGVFSYCLLDYLDSEGSQSFTPFLDLLSGAKSPGRIFRITESNLVEYLIDFKKITNGHYDFDNTAGMQQLIKVKDEKIDKFEILKIDYV